MKNTFKAKNTFAGLAAVITAIVLSAALPLTSCDNGTSSSGGIFFPPPAVTPSATVITIAINMYDSYGDGWNGGGALRIVVNGVQIATNVKVQSGYTNTYAFNVTTGDVVQLYWIAGSDQEENSFIAYYADTPPSPAFTASNNDSWNGSNALVYKLRGTMNNISGGMLLGSFTVQNGNASGDTVINIPAIQGVTIPAQGETPVTGITENEQYSGTVTWSPNHPAFAAATEYTATIMLTPKSGYTLRGVAADFFTVDGAASVSNAAHSGDITAVFPSTDAIAITIAAIQGVTVPVTGEIPVASITENEQYSGTVIWSPNHPAFAAATEYTATIMLTPKSGYTLRGVTANFFTVAGAMSVSFNVNSGVITAMFPATASTGGNTTRSVTVDMYDSYGDGWDGGGALRIVVNGVQIATNVKVQSGYTNTYAFNVTTGDVVQLYWIAGPNQEENSFIAYYTDTPPSPAFTASNNSSWNGSNALVYKLRGTMNNISGGMLLGSFTVQNGNASGDTVINIAAIQGVTVPVTGGIPVTSITENEQYSGTVTWSPNHSAFAATTQYTATIRLTAKTGYTLQGVTANFFTVAGAMSVSFNANSGVITAVFPQTVANIINIAAIQGVTVPVTGGIPVTSITENEQYSGTVTWSPNHSAFAATTQYTATIRLTAKTGYTLQGVTANFFTVAGAMSVSFNVNSGVITAMFPQTAAVTPVSRIEYYWVDQHGSLVTTSGGATTVAAGATLTITAQSTGYVVKQWHLDGVNTGQSGNTYNFSSTTAGKHIVGLFVEKDSKLYNTNININVNVNNVTRSVTINMYDSYGDGWDGNGALRINVNGIDIANNVKVQSGYTNTYTFNVTTGDVVQVYWVAGSGQGENSFIVYYTNTPPSPAFTTSNNNSWNGSNALVYKLQGTMNSISGGTLLGSFTVR
jgi:hypothetical protein